MNTITFIQLGRIGDIINILPAVEEHFLRTRNKPYLVVAAEFAGLLPHVQSYATGEAYPGPWMDIRGAIRWVLDRRPLTDLRICTVCGDDYALEKQAWNFQREAWRLSRCPVPWGVLRPHIGSIAWNYVCDEFLIPENRAPFVLVSLAGLSSPVPQETRELILARLRERFTVVDITDYRARNIVDMLPLIFQSDAFVVCDSALMHLARAVGLTRVCALVSDNPDTWYKSWWTPEQIFRCCYHEIPERIDELVGSIDRSWELPSIVHCWSKAAFSSTDTLRRQAIAQQSWVSEYQDSGRLWIPAPLHDCVLTRDARSIGDPIPMPFIRDIIDHGISRSNSRRDIIVVTNADVGWPHGITGAILDTVRMHGSAWTHRWDKEGDQLTDPPRNEWDVGKLNWYPGSDLFAFTVDWWEKHGDEFPDMILGREAWDYVMRSLIKRHGGGEIRHGVFHERHASFWESSGNRAELRGNVHNLELARTFMDCRVHENDLFTPADLVFAA